MENELINITNDKKLRITSVELVDIINDFRKLECGTIGKEYKELRHDNFLTKVEKEVEVLNSLGLNAALNFKESKYLDKNKQSRPCYQLNRDGMLQMLNSESTLVRYKTIEYINKLEEENEILKLNQQFIQENKELKETLADFKRATEEAKQQYKPSHKRKLDYNKMIKTLTNNEEEVQVVKDWVFGLLNIEKWEDTCVDDSKKIIETITTVARLLTIKKFEQLSFL